MRGIRVGLVAGLAVMGLATPAHAADGGLRLDWLVQGQGTSNFDFEGAWHCNPRWQLDDRKTTTCDKFVIPAGSGDVVLHAVSTGGPEWRFAGWQGCDVADGETCT